MALQAVIEFEHKTKIITTLSLTMAYYLSSVTYSYHIMIVSLFNEDKSSSTTYVIMFVKSKFTKQVMYK